MRKGTAKRVAKATENGKADANAVVPMSLRLDQPLYERLRQLAFDQRKPMREFIIRGIEMVLKAEKR